MLETTKIFTLRKPLKLKVKHSKLHLQEAILGKKQRKNRFARRGKNLSSCAMVAHYGEDPAVGI